MIPVMVKEADLNRLEVPEDYEVLDATALLRDTGGISILSLVAFVELSIAGAGILLWQRVLRS